MADVSEPGVAQRPSVDPGPRLAESGPALIHSVHLVEHHQFTVAVCDACGWRSFARRSRQLARDEGHDHELLHNTG